MPFFPASKYREEGYDGKLGMDQRTAQTSVSDTTE